MWELTLHEEDKSHRGLSLYILDTDHCPAQGQEVRKDDRALGKQTGIDRGLGSGVMPRLKIWLCYFQKCDLRQLTKSL